MEQLNYAQVRICSSTWRSRSSTARPSLTEVDSQIGDGDHGIGMERA